MMNIEFSGRGRKRAGAFRVPGHAGMSLLVLSALLLASPSPASVAGEARVELATDTVWEGTVNLSGEVRVLEGATLLIQPGTTVRFAGGKDGEGGTTTRLVVQGTLVAQGTPEAPILFTSASAQPAPGDWGGIVLNRANARPNRLRHCFVEYAREGIRGAYSLLLAEDTEFRKNDVGLLAQRDLKGGFLRCTFRENGTGAYFHQSSAVTVDHSQVRDNREAGIVCVFGSSPAVRHSGITDNGKVGISCLQGSSPLVEDNRIAGHERGLYIELQSRPRIVRNDIVSNDTGVWAEKLVFPKIAGNLVARNGTGIYCNYSAYPEIHGNNIVDNERFGLVLGDNMSIVMEKQIPFRSMGRFSFDRPPEEPEMLPPQSRKFAPFTASDEGVVDARGNWWGPAALREMDESGSEGNISVIEDARDKPDTWYQDKTYPRDRVVFSPWEEGPVQEAGRSGRALAGVRGKVIFGGAPKDGLRVHAYREAEGDFRGEGFSYSAPAAQDGSFSMTLAPGSYFLVAKGPDPPFPHLDPGPEGYFGYYGGNPLTVAEGLFTESNIQVVKRKAPRVVEEEGREGTVLEGVVEGPSGPIPEASVHVYTDAARQFRGPGLFGPQGAVVGGTDATGRFSIELPPGRYYLVASKRRNGGFLGPLRPGDLHGWYDGNPVAATAGSRTSLTLQVVEKLREVPVPRRGGGGATAIRGRIRDPEGNVPPGVYAYATTDASFMIGAMPPYRSRPLSDDGSYTIDLPEGGTYYIGARSGYGGPPLPGEWHGFLGGEAPVPVDVATGATREGADFTVRKME